MKDYSEVTMKEYYDKKRAIFRKISGNDEPCSGIVCDECPFNDLEKRLHCICSKLEIMHLDEMVDFVMNYNTEPDWSKVAVNTPIWVKSRSEDEWIKRHFARYEDGKVCAFQTGSTSWSAKDSDDITAWKYAKLADNVTKEYERKDVYGLTRLC